MIMCGIAGFIDSKPFRSQAVLGDYVQRMVNALVHRGPDDIGLWTDPKYGIALGFRRLSILDLSQHGHQPMVSTCGRYVLVFNGEIYNFKALREELIQRGSREFRGHSDTEVLLAAIGEFGLRKAIEKCNGMFALALWDRQECTISLVRDRMGEKPLYYGWTKDSFIFASELKAFTKHPDFDNEIDQDVLALYLRHSYVPCPYSIYKHVYKLPPGTLLTLSTNNLTTDVSPDPFWSLQSVVEEGRLAPYSMDHVEAIDELDNLLRDSIKLRMVADVPIGAFLSGGIDSSTVVALMQAQNSHSVKTFTIGFEEAGFDEAKYAKVVARELGTDHTELYLSSKEAQDIIPKLPILYDEPFGDASQIPTFLIAQLAKRNVTVSLSGDGGDELFAGYNRYFWCLRLWNSLQRIPPFLKRGLSKGIKTLHPHQWDFLFAKFDRLLPASLKQRNPSDKIYKFAELLDSQTPEEMHYKLISIWKDPSILIPQANEPLTAFTHRESWPSLSDFVQRMMYLDSITYLSEDILTKVDRASMGVSLEVRIPLLDHRVVEFAWKLPLSMKFHNGKGKWLLRQVLYKYLPPKLVERPKMGFGVPIDSWLRHSLREWAESLLDSQRIKREGFLDPDPIQRKWNEHVLGVRDWQYPLWNVLMFQSWLESQR